jgi:hypothetical protein
VAIEDPYWVDRDRGDLLREQVAEMLAFADYLQRSVVPAMGKRYVGSTQSIYDAMCDQSSPIYLPREQRPALRYMQQAATVHRKHRPEFLDDYIRGAKVPTKKGYLAVLRGKMPLDQI